MGKDLHYDSTAGQPQTGDPYARASFSLANRALRLLWGMIWLLLFRPSPRPAHGWRAWLLRRFGAKLGPGCRIYSSVRIWAPWNLTCQDLVAIGDGAEIYNQGPISIGSHAIISQGAYLCASTHDHNSPDFPLLAYPMRIGAYAWIAARAVVGPKVDVGEGAVLGLASVATRDLEPWTVYAGSPARKVKERVRFLEKQGIGIRE